MLSFDNTEIAFSGRTNQELRRAYWLYRLIGVNWLVRWAPSLLKIALTLRLPIVPLIRSTVFQHFCGGESIATCETRIQELGRHQIGTILDYSAEGKATEEDFEHATEELLASIRYAQNHPLIPFAVFKPTGIARFELLEKVNANLPLSTHESAEFKRVTERVLKICQLGHDLSVPILIDAEESWIQEAIDTLALDMMRRFNHTRALIFTTVQLYRKGRLEHLRKLFLCAEQEGFFLGVKLVRGAYMEKERARAEALCLPDPICPTKEDTDGAFDEGLKFCLEHLDRIALCCGSHNEGSNLYLAHLMDHHGVPRDDPRIYFSQLLGMGDHISVNLAAAGFNVAKYVPYGPVKDVLPYLLRRAEENRSIAGQTSRELDLIQSETARRRDTPH